MPLDPGWNLPRPDLRRIRVLEYVATSEPGAFILMPNDVGEPGDDEYEATVAVLDQFEAQGWAKLQRNAAVGPASLLTGAGKEAIDDIRAKRVDPNARRRAAPDAVLHWISEAQAWEPGTTPNLAAFWGTPYSIYWGELFDRGEIDRASRDLKEDGLIRGDGALGYGIIRPTITAKGQRLVDSGRSVNDPIPASVAGIVVTGDNNVILAHSPGASQTITTTITEDHRQQSVQLADSIEAAQSTLSPEAVAAAANLRGAAAAGQNDIGKMKAALAQIKETLTSGAGELVGKVILASVTGLMAHYGIPVA